TAQDVMLSAQRDDGVPSTGCQLSFCIDNCQTGPGNNKEWDRIPPMCFHKPGQIKLFGELCCPNLVSILHPLFDLLERQLFLEEITAAKMRSELFVFFDLAPWSQLVRIGSSEQVCQV